MVEMKKKWAERLGNIPQNWKISKISSIYNQRKTKVSDKDYSPLSVTMQWIVPQLETAAKSDAHDDRKLVKKWDFVINSRSDRRWSCWISDFDWSVSLINTVMQPKEKMDPWYFNWLFHTKQFADEFYKRWHWIVDDLRTTNWQDMKHIDIPMPSLDLQKKISSLLDKEVFKINDLYSDIKNEIEKLNSYKKSIINEIVTKWIDLNREMKKSWIVWVDMIPDKWSVKRLKYIVNSISKWNWITKDDVVIDWDIQCIRYWEIYSKYDNYFTETESLTNIDKIDKPKYISKGDILFAWTWELIEEIWKNIVYMWDNPCLAWWDIIIVKHSCNPYFLNYALNSTYSQNQKSCGRFKLKVVHISWTNIWNLLIALPPKEEQDIIAETLNVKCSKIDNVIKNKKKQLEILEKYIKSTIYEYVTGKKEIPSNF